MIVLQDNAGCSCKQIGPRPGRGPEGLKLLRLVAGFRMLTPADSEVTVATGPALLGWTV